MLETMPYVRIVEWRDGNDFDGSTLLPPGFYDETGFGEAAIGPCIGCKVPFMFKAATVLSIRLSVPDLRPNPSPDEASEKFPCCNRCGSRFNELRPDKALPLPRESSR
jgi:hypothetical protein